MKKITKLREKKKKRKKILNQKKIKRTLFKNLID